MKQPLIVLDKLCAGYDGKIAVQNASFTVYEHDFLGVIGPNGGGKTTLMRLLLGLKKPSEGSITYYRNGQIVKDLSIGYLPQYNGIDKAFPISVQEVILSGLSKQKPVLRPFTQKQHQQVQETIGQMGLSGLEKRAIGELSGGQLQRVLLARAMVSQPEVLVLDEPNTYIDQQFQQQMYQLLDQFNAQCSIIMVSHDVGSILQNVKNVVCVNKSVHYHPKEELSEDILNEHLGCSVELLAHGNVPHRVLKKHD